MLKFKILGLKLPSGFDPSMVEKKNEMRNVLLA